MSRNLIAAGIDIGSRTIKLVLYDGQSIIYSKVLLNTHNTLEICNNLLNNKEYDVIVATGYGRGLFELEFDVPTITEIKAFARGCHKLFLGPQIIIDIGGQDTKVIRIGDQGEVIKFEMNDRCAAGTGKFIEIMSSTLNYSLEEFAIASVKADKVLTINSMCTVFAESEITSLIARGEKRENIAYSLHKSVVKRTISMLNRLNNHQEEIVFCGGCAYNQTLKRLLEKATGKTIKIPSNPQIVGALGSSIIAYEMINRK